MKKLLILCLIFSLLLLCAGCGDSKKDDAADAPVASVGLANPIHDSSREEILSLDGIDMVLPADAEQAAYTRIVSENSVIDQVDFALNGLDYCYRSEKSDEAEDISGMYYEWSNEMGDGTADSPRLSFTDDGIGFVRWFVDGRSFSVSMDAGATEATLLSIFSAIID